MASFIFLEFQFSSYRLMLVVPFGLPWLRLMYSKGVQKVLTTIGAEELLMAVMAFIFDYLFCSKLFIMSLISQGLRPRLVSMIFFNTPFGYLSILSDMVSVNSISSHISIFRF